jgi:predicted nucleic acid-binding protein
VASGVFFDTNVLIYFAIENDHRTAKAEDLLRVGGHVSVQALNEFAAVAHRKLKMPWKKIAESLEIFRELCEPPSPITVAIHEAAVGISERYRYHIFDALMIASAIKSGCSVLYSEDMHDGQRIDSLIIRNPFTPL